MLTTDREYQVSENRTNKPVSMQAGSPDNFQTPASALDPLVPFLKKHWLIIEPSCGKGNLVRGLSERGFKVQGFDIENGDDFLKEKYDGDCYLTNPPFSIKHKFLHRCYELGKPFALLMPLTTFDSKQRQALFKKHGISVIFMPKRVNFETPSGKGSGSWFATAWFCWKLDLPSQLVFSGHDEELFSGDA